jgi:Rps23 Pro-64 3,4-dihydroxylase Tpa1-like proline 4-hydroxylase
MPNQENLNLSSAVAQNTPFPHFSATSVLNNQLEVKLYNWFQSTAEWNLVETDFYEQYEFSLLNINLPEELKCLIEPDFLNIIENQFTESFNVKGFKIVDIVAHKLVNSQHIGVHNDFINGEETHRMVLHINPHWKEEHGGYLLLFNSSDSFDMSKIVSPIDNSAFGFEISRKSHHAVSKIYDFARYTIVYTFKHL